MGASLSGSARAPEIHPEDLEDSKHILPKWNGRQHMRGDPVAKRLVCSLDNPHRSISFWPEGPQAPKEAGCGPKCVMRGGFLTTCLATGQTIVH